MRLRKSKWVLMLLPVLAFMTGKAQDTNYVVVSGQVINYEYGSPVENHPVFIKETDNNNYSREDGDVIQLKTDKEGFYYDSIATTRLKGAFEIYTYDYYGNRLDTTLHYRFLFFNSNVLVANFRIYMPYQMDQLQAKFNYYQKQSGDRFTYLFRDLTENEHIVSRKWTFGDGTVSHKKTVTHTYAAPGFYKITLTVEAMVNNTLQSSTFSRMIYLPDRSFYNFGGHVFSEYFPIDYGVAFLYIIDSSRAFIPVDTAYFDTLGYYYFYQVPEADYLVKAQPTEESEYYGTLLPTYYGNRLFWEDAESIHLTATGWEYDIHLQQGEGMEAGNGSVHGNIRFFNQLKSGGNTPVEGIPVYLMNNDHVSLVYRYSDSLGFFNFSNIAFGEYLLIPEITGVHSNEVSIEVSAFQPEVDSISILIIDGEATLSVPEQKKYYRTEMDKLWPVPVSGVLHVSVTSVESGTMQWQIISAAQGTTLLEGNQYLKEGSNLLNIDTRKLNSGFYLLQLTTPSGLKYRKKFVVGEQ